MPFNPSHFVRPELGSVDKRINPGKKVKRAVATDSE
jgi:hypothetical protein